MIPKLGEKLYIHVAKNGFIVTYDSSSFLYPNKCYVFTSYRKLSTFLKSRLMQENTQGEIN